MSWLFGNWYGMSHRPEIFRRKLSWNIYGCKFLIQPEKFLNFLFQSAKPWDHQVGPALAPYVGPMTSNFFKVQLFEELYSLADETIRTKMPTASLRRAYVFTLVIDKFPTLARLRRALRVQSVEVNTIGFYFCNIIGIPNHPICQRLHRLGKNIPLIKICNFNCLVCALFIIDKSQRLMSNLI